MKRILSFFFILLLLAGLCACGTTTPAATDSSTPLPAEPLSPTAVPESPIHWADAYTAFAQENHETLQSACFGGVAGVGFLDLDLDGTPEMVLFDSGASAYMGVQLFDLTDGGDVVCVSASSVEAGLAFGGETLSPLYVNALFFDDFRLMESADGHRWFQVLSKNGAEDFYYNELLRFVRDEQGLLMPESLYYKRISIDPATGEEIAGEYTVSGIRAEEKACSAAEASAKKAGEDTGYTAAGVFLWSDKSFGYDRDGLLAMVRSAIDVYVPVE